MSERIATEVDGVALSLTNLEKALFPDGFTKSELISYYLEIAEVMLPHLAERAITRVRYPEGTAKGSFFEKNAPQGSPEWVGTTEVATSAGSVRYVVVDQRATLVWLANLASIELHAPQWRLPDTTTGDDGIVLRISDEALRSASDVCRSRFEKTFLQTMASWLVDADKRLGAVP